MGELPVGALPDSYHFITTAAGEMIPVRIETHTPDTVRMPLQSLVKNQPTVSLPPNSYAAITASTREVSTCRVEMDAPHNI